MNSKIQNHSFILIFFIALQIPFIGENELNKRDDPPELRDLQEQTFGTATLRFSETGTKYIITVNDFPKEDLVFFLKKGGNLFKIDEKDLAVVYSTKYYYFSSEALIYAKQFTYFK